MFEFLNPFIVLIQTIWASCTKTNFLAIIIVVLLIPLIDHSKFTFVIEQIAYFSTLLISAVGSVLSFLFKSFGSIITNWTIPFNSSSSSSVSDNNSNNLSDADIAELKDHFSSSLTTALGPLESAVTKLNQQIATFQANSGKKSDVQTSNIRSVLNSISSISSSIEELPEKVYEAVYFEVPEEDKQDTQNIDPQAQEEFRFPPGLIENESSFAFQPPASASSSAPTASSSQPATALVPVANSSLGVIEEESNIRKVVQTPHPKKTLDFSNISPTFATPDSPSEPVQQDLPRGAPSVSTSSNAVPVANSERSVKKKSTKSRKLVSPQVRKSQRSRRPTAFYGHAGK